MREVGKRWSHAELGVGQEHLVTSQLRACLRWCVHKREPRVLLLGTSLVLEKRDHTRRGEVMARVPARTQVWFGGPAVEGLAEVAPIRTFSDFESLDAALLAFQATASG